MVLEYKKKNVEDLANLVRQYPIIGLANMANLPAPQLQAMKKEMMGKVELFMTKKRLMKIVFDNLKDEKKNIQELANCFEGMPALLFTNDNPFKLSKLLQKSKTNAPAKAGQIAPQDIIITKGPTPFAPGPIISELGSIGLKVGVEGGKVAIKEDAVVARKGEKIRAKVAEVLARLDIKPMQVGLGLVAAYEDGIIYKKDALDIDEKEFSNKISTAAREAFNLAFNIIYTTKDNIKLFITKAFNDARALGISQEIFDGGIIQELLGKAERQMLSLKSIAGINVQERTIESKSEEVKKEEQKEEKQTTEDETDKKVKAMVEKIKKFAEGKEETASYLLKEVEQEEKVTNKF